MAIAKAQARRRSQGCCGLVLIRGCSSAPKPRRINCLLAGLWSRSALMSTTKPRSLMRLEYAEAAEAYLRSLPPEHFMEATPQSIQRVITSESLDLVKAERAEIQYFNELCVQYPWGEPSRIRQVVPDTMVVVHDEPIQAVTSYDIPLQPVRPYWM